jgi:hypothetical protein
MSLMRLIVHGRMYGCLVERVSCSKSPVRVEVNLLICYVLPPSKMKKVCSVRVLCFASTCKVHSVSPIYTLFTHLDASYKDQTITQLSINPISIKYFGSRYFKRRGIESNTKERKQSTSARPHWAAESPCSASHA